MQAVSAGRGLTGQLALFRPLISPASVDVYAVSRPAREFTGDFFYTRRDGQRLWFALGDVAGKGINAAVIMAMIQEELEARIETLSDPAAVMAHLHEFLRTVLPPNKFASAVIGHLHDDGSLIVANAGHCAPVIVRESGATKEIGSTGPVAGILPVARWRSTSEHLETGDSLVLYSDGLAEARDDAGEEFGTRGVRAAASGRSAREIGESILAAAYAYAAEDDLTLVVLTA